MTTLMKASSFIPLNKWHIIVLSLFMLHNETREQTAVLPILSSIDLLPVNIHTHMIPLLHSTLALFPHLNYASVPVDRPEAVFTVFAQICLFSSVLWHTMSGCAHRGGMELCARVDYVGIGWYASFRLFSFRFSGRLAKNPLRPLANITSRSNAWALIITFFRYFGDLPQ